VVVARRRSDLLKPWQHNMLAALRLTRRPVPSLLIGRRSLSNVAPPPRQPAMMAPGTGSGRGGTPIPGEIPGGPKPVVYRGMVINSKVRARASRSARFGTQEAAATRFFLIFSPTGKGKI
jgi:hypothetical protein